MAIYVYTITIDVIPQAAEVAGLLVESQTNVPVQPEEPFEELCLNTTVFPGCIVIDIQSLFMSDVV